MEYLSRCWSVSGYDPWIWTELEKREYEKRDYSYNNVCRVIHIDGVLQQQCDSKPSEKQCSLKPCALFGLLGCNKAFFKNDATLCGTYYDQSEWTGCKILYIDGMKQQQCTDPPKYCARNHDLFGHDVGAYMKDNGKTLCGEDPEDNTNNYEIENKLPGKL